MEAISEESLQNSFDFAIYDRIKRECFYNPIEINYAIKNRKKIIAEVHFDIQHPSSYIQRTAFCFYAPKTKLTFRRMIYIPIKDLIIRYSVFYQIAKQLDAKLIENCFSNRLERDSAKKQFLQDYAENGHPNWCNWQHQKCEGDSVLLKTDISSYYDSISHNYLSTMVANDLNIPIESKFMNLFIKILQIPIVAYSTKTKKINSQSTIQQGLAIGNNCDGFIANLYLNDTDHLMESLPNISYGRYVDDIRIFAKNRVAAMHSMRILQENLLGKGLNLNGAKTELAEDKESKLQIASKVPSPTGEEENEYREALNSQLKGKIDKQLFEFNETFKAKPDFLEIFDEKDSRAKDYCKYLSTKDESDEFKFVKLKERNLDHIYSISEIIKKWQGASKHASWLLIESAFYNKVLKNVRQEAKKQIISLLKSKEVSSYAKYRILHHLLKRRNNSNHSNFLKQLNKKYKDSIYELIPTFLDYPSLELNIFALILIKYKCTSKEFFLNEIEDLKVTSKKSEPIPEFMDDAIDMIKKIRSFKEGIYIKNHYKIDNYAS